MKYNLKNDGIYYSDHWVKHNNVDFDEKGFETLFKMQKNHFWYVGRHKFLEAKLKKILGKYFNKSPLIGHKPLQAIDIGGGVGGWVDHISRSSLKNKVKVSLADSSPFALNMAKKMVTGGEFFYCVDLMKLGMEDQWDVVFLLDVIEHIGDDKKALAQVYESLRPGGFAFITMPALNFFWSANDEYTGHHRRYNKADLRFLAQELGFKLLDASYFMFFLSPVYFLARKKLDLVINIKGNAYDEIIDAHQVPPKLLNWLLAMVFCAETPISSFCSYPWGTSILGVLQKPAQHA